jgi:hypothetical protein
MPTPRRLLTLFASLALVLAVSACKSESCDPADPLCNAGGGGGGGGGNTTVANVLVDSPVDTVMAVGRTVPMTAAAVNSDGDTLAATIVWNSTDTGVATVSGSGVVSALSAGTTNVQASSGGQTGQIAMRAVDANLAGISAALGDAFASALAAALTGTPASNLQALLTTCSNQIAAGHVRAIDQCLTSALGVSSGDTNDQALLGVLAIYFAYSQQQLNL